MKIIVEPCDTVMQVISKLANYKVAHSIRSFPIPAFTDDQDIFLLTAACKGDVLEKCARKVHFACSKCTFLVNALCSRSVVLLLNYLR
jgi:hypothetical protein